jgi:hypothetical protein
MCVYQSWPIEVHAADVRPEHVRLANYGLPMQELLAARLKRTGSTSMTRSLGRSPAARAYRPQSERN